MTANTGSRQPYLKHSCVRGSGRRGGDRRHMDKSAAHTQAHTHKRTRTYTVHMRAHTDTNTCTVLAHRSLIFSSNHLLSATAAFTANCSCVCVCVYVINQWCDSAPQTAMVAQLLPFYTHLIHFVSFVMDKADNLLLSEKCFGL